MLSAADAELAARDPKLPGLATLLDERAIGSRLEEATGRVLEGIRLHYLRYKPGTNCLAAYRARVDGAETDLYAKAHGPDASEKLDKGCGASSPLRVGLEDVAIAAYFFPEDRKLPVLARLSDPEARERLLRRIFDEAPGMSVGSLEPLAYKPERRYVARFEGRRSCVLKFYVGEERAAARAGARAIRSRDVLRVADKRGGSKRHGVLAFDWLPGRNLRELFEARAVGESEIALVARGIAELHAQPAETLRARRPDERSRELRELARTAGVLAPQEASRAATLAARIASQLAEEPEPTGCIHGDLYDKQILVAGDQVGIIDLDRAARGDPRIDLGLFVAHLERDALLGRLPPGLVARFESELLGAYRAARGMPVAAFGPYVAEALLHLAHHPFRAHLPSWPELTRDLLAAAERRLG